MKTVSFNAFKGGTGKTTLSIITINALMAQGFKCLAIDADIINHSLSFYYNSGIPFDTIQAQNIFKVFTGEDIADNVIKVSDHLDLLHADVRLSDFRSTDNTRRLKKQIQGLKGYDYVVIDTSPVYDNIIANVYHASDYLIVPTVADSFNHQSVRFLLRKLGDLDLSDLDAYVQINHFVKPRSDNKETFRNQVVDLFKSDPEIEPFLAGSIISESSVIERYINDRGFRINDRKETVKQYAEIRDFLTGTLSITLNGKGI